MFFFFLLGIIMLKSTFYLMLAACLLSFGTPAAYAQGQGGGNVDILPALSSPENISHFDESEATHPPLRLTPDKSELVRLDRKAASIIIGNPSHLNILAENARTLVLISRIPGATYFSVLDPVGDVIMQRHVIVASPKKKYLRIRRSCAASENRDCTETDVYYCPDMCHEISITGEDEENAGAEMPEATSQAAPETDANTGE